MACPICRSGRGTALPTRVAPVWACRDCGHLAASLSSAHQERLEDTYADESYEGFRDDPVFVANALDVLRAIPLQESGVDLLDVGCGSGMFLRAAADAGYNVVGIDVSAAAVRMCQARGIPARVSGIGESTLGSHWDVLTMWDVIEHVPDPLRFLSDAADRLRPGGFIIVKTPAFDTKRTVALLRRVPRLAAPILALPDHVNVFSPASLRLAMETSGFEIDEVCSRGNLRRPARGGSLRKRVLRTATRMGRTLIGSGNVVAVAHVPTRTRPDA